MLETTFRWATLMLLAAGCVACGSTSEAPPAASAEAEPATGAEAAPVPPLAEPAKPLVSQVFVIESGLATPESVLHDAKRDVYYVSNIKGSPLDVDDNGYISKIAADGTVIAEKWIDGGAKNVKLNAPKGMALVGDWIYVSDIDHVRKFDAETGKPKGQLRIPGATFLNDVVAADDGTVYVSDSGMKAGAGGLEPSNTDAIYAISKGNKVKALVKKPELGRPNGLVIVGDQLVVVTFGSGQLYTVARADGTQGAPQDLPGGQLDGVAALADGRLIVSSWGGQSVLAGKLGEAFTLLIENVPSPADIGVDASRSRVLVPSFMGNKVAAYELSK